MSIFFIIWLILIKYSKIKIKSKNKLFALKKTLKNKCEIVCRIFDLNIMSKYINIIKYLMKYAISFLIFNYN